MKDFEIEGLQEWERWVHGLANTVENRIVNEVDKSGSNIERTAKFNAPVDTGDLRKSLTKEMDRSVSSPITEVFSLLPYADDVETGTSKQRAQPYLFPALNQEIPELEKAIKDIVRKELG